jgi:hypothetical protein
MMYEQAAANLDQELSNLKAGKQRDANSAAPLDLCLTPSIEQRLVRTVRLLRATDDNAAVARPWWTWYAARQNE